MTEYEIKRLEDRIRELWNEKEDLLKENAELKAEIENDRDLPTVAYMQGAEKQKKKDEKQLTKAKEIIKGLLDLPDLIEDRTSEHTELIGRAEQFLEEEA